MSGTTMQMISSIRRGLPPEPLTIRSVATSSAPVRTRPALTTNMAATVIVALFEKPESASPGGSTPVASSATMMSIDVSSIEIHCVT